MSHFEYWSISTRKLSSKGEITPQQMSANQFDDEVVSVEKQMIELRQVLFSTT